MISEFQLKQSKSGHYYFSLLGRYGQVLLQSEMYEAKAGALKGIESIKLNGVLDEQYDKLVSKSEKPYFVIKAKNYQVIGQSQMYESEVGRDNGIDAVKSAVVNATITDFTVLKG